MQTVVATSIFRRRADKLLSEDERRALIDFLAWNPDAGQEIQGTGGVRKVRFAAKGKGRSGGVRVIYFVAGTTIPIYALLIYGKGEQAELTGEQLRQVKALAHDIKAAGDPAGRRG
jgi:mRNA-degrading endonuclease RelE of RelBE toxin-antitoxin system